jgi:hypothetical protein
MKKQTIALLLALVARASAAVTQTNDGVTATADFLAEVWVWNYSIQSWSPEDLEEQGMEIVSDVRITLELPNGEISRFLGYNEPLPEQIHFMPPSEIISLDTGGGLWGRPVDGVLRQQLQVLVGGQLQTLERTSAILVPMPEASTSLFVASAFGVCLLARRRS